MKNPTLRAGLLLGASLAATAVALAQSAQPSKAELAIRYRQALYFVLGSNFAPLGAVVQGKAPYDAKDFEKRAERVAFIADMLPESFGPDSQSGAQTAAKPEIWTNRAEFDKLLADMQDKTLALAQASQGSNLEAIKPAFVAAAQTCKNCHDKFKEK
jgi:cytochrome c556